MGGSALRTPDSWISRFCYNHPNFGIPGLIRYIVFANIAVYLVDIFYPISLWLSLVPSQVLHGQVWRLVTFVMVPESYSASGLGPVWFVFYLLFTYFLGSTLEQTWGTAKFSLFYLSGAVLTILAAFISYGLTSLFWGDIAYIFGQLPFTVTEINFSILLAFATLYPDSEFRIYFIIPIKAKWLAVLYLLLELWSYMRLGGAMLLLFLPVMLPSDLAALLNYLFFFWSDVGNLFGRANARRKHQVSRQTINFKKAQKEVRERKGYLHKCAVCGITDADDPNMEFRYCSKCNGYYCYCMNHINNHTHVQ